MKQLRVLLLPHGRDASPLQGYPPPPPAVCRRYHLHVYMTWMERDNVGQSILSKETK